ncbi:MAG: hypothetical protein V7771_14930 [Shewanella psychromarinicola]|jgi:hypothetical protein|nr:hypothetical protein [Shewanella sp. Actino-trap-3]PKG79744.1 hypothetical protein CXF80_16325 [Shewanella sp. Actino-trap-3]|tara:strand:- start:40596 stop:40994 length:399 start_codon:yes stop_codon:yes gene_type:complete
MRQIVFTVSSAAMLIAVLVSGCSNLSLRTNAGTLALGNATIAGVDTYTSTGISRFKAQFLGDVTTSYCEISSNPEKLDDLPSTSSMIKSLKLQVTQRGGNAIVLKQCGKVNYPSCAVYLECNGEAYVIDRGF